MTTTEKKKTHNDYYSEALEPQMKVINDAHTTQLEADAKTKQQINAAIDTATQATVGGYQQQINDAPSASRPLYDANALQEAVNRKKIQESMANMGLSQSGLSDSMSTALAVQKNKADSEVAQQERAYVQQLENIISQTVTAAESEKLEQANAIDRATAEQYNTALGNAATSAAGAAATMVAADSAAQQAEIDRQFQSALQTRKYELEQGLIMLQGKIQQAQALGDHFLASQLQEEKANLDTQLIQLSAASKYSAETLLAAAEYEMELIEQRGYSPEDARRMANEWFGINLGTATGSSSSVIDTLRGTLGSAFQTAGNWWKQVEKKHTYNSFFN